MGAQLIEVKLGATRLKVAVCATLPNVAVMTAVWFAESSPTGAVKVAVAAPAGTLTDAGVESAAALLESATAVLVVPALFRVTVQVVAPPDRTLLGVQTSEESEEMAVDTFRFKLADWELTPNFAVTVAV